MSRLGGPLANWEIATLSEVLHDENAKTSLKQKEYMTILRHALTGMKVSTSLHGIVGSYTYPQLQTGPTVADVLFVLGAQRSIARLQSLVA